MGYLVVPSKSARPGYHSMTPRIVVEDVAAQVNFLRTVFGTTGTVEPGRPAEIVIGDSLVMVSPSSPAGSVQAFLYVYVDETRTRPTAERSMLVPCRWKSRWKGPTGTVGPWCEIRSATSSRSPIS